MVRQVQIGAVVGIPVTKGNRFAVYSHEHKKMGSLIHVFSEIASGHPDNFDIITTSRVLFSCFVPLGAIIEQGILSIVTVLPNVPSALRPFPVFRTGVVDRNTGKVSNWWLWDGEKEWMVGKINSAQRKLPIRGIWNDTLLKERAESGWTVADDPR